MTSAAGAVLRRLVGLIALVVALGISLPTALWVRAENARRADRLDARVSAAVRDVTAVVGEDDAGGPDVDVYTATPQGAGSPTTFVLDAKGRFTAGDRAVPSPVQRAARARAMAERSDPATIGSGEEAVRLVALPILGEKRAVGVAAAFTRRQDGGRTLALQAIAGALAAWLLLVLATALLVERALRSGRREAAREHAFLSDAAHELRTPWAIVQGRAEQALRDGVRPGDLEAIAATSTAAGATIGDMLELARDAGRALSERDPLRLDTLVATALSEQSERIVDLGVRVTADLEEQVEVEADERLLHRAVENLLDNALRHGAAGGVLEVALRSSDGDARLTVADRGPGLPPGERDAVFERFHRGRTAQPGGAGLGLAIARLVAEAHGGTLAVVGDGPGACFALTLPLR